jgi:hypothetical protein
MSTAMLERLRAQRDEQIAFVATTVERANADERDLVEAELANVAAARQRVAQIDAQIAPIVEFEESRAAGSELLARMPGAGPTATAVGSEFDGQPAGRGRRGAVATSPMAAAAAAFGYASPGAFILDKLRARGVDKWNWKPDPAAAERIAAVERHTLANQTTANTPGLLPVPIIGSVVDTVDGSRPFMTSMGVKPLAGIPGKSFSRPKIVTHTQSGVQAVEKTALASRAMQIEPVDFNKETHGGYVNISRQDIDWTVPAAWDALINDLAKMYGLDVETAVTALFAAGLDVTNKVDLPGPAPTLQQWMTALYTAAGKVYAGCGQLPDMYWCSIDMWASLGALTDVARVQSTPGGDGNLGTSSLTRFSGNLLDLPRIVVPTFPAGTLVVGNSGYFEIYEEQVGLISAVEPSIMGVEVAYGGYAAAGFLEAKGFSNIVKPLVAGDVAEDQPPLTADAQTGRGRK